MKKIENISGDDKLWRVLSEHHIKKGGELKSSFFRDKSGLSCDLASLTTQDESIRGIRKEPRPPNSGLVEITVANIRSDKINGEVTHDPLEEDLEKETRENKAHCLIKPSSTNTDNDNVVRKKLTDGQIKECIRKAVIIVELKTSNE